MLGPVCEKRQAWSRSKTVFVDTSRCRVNRLVHFFGILFALTMYALKGFFLPIRCINFGMVHNIYRRVTAFNFKIKLNFFLCVSLFYICGKQCRPWWNASFRLGLHCLPDGTHLCPISINGSSIIFRKIYIYLSAHMITVLNSYPPKSVLLSIFIMRVWEKWSLTYAEVQSFAARRCEKIINS